MTEKVSGSTGYVFLLVAGLQEDLSNILRQSRINYILGQGQLCWVAASTEVILLLHRTRRTCW